MNQIPHAITSLTGGTIKSLIYLASPIELDEEAITEQVQVTSTIEPGANEE